MTHFQKPENYTDIYSAIMSIITLQKNSTHCYVGPPDDDLRLAPHEEGVEAHVVYTEVHPALTRHLALPVAARVV